MPGDPPDGRHIVTRNVKHMEGRMKTEVEEHYNPNCRYNDNGYVENENYDNSSDYIKVYSTKGKKLILLSFFKDMVQFLVVLHILTWINTCKPPCR